VIARGIFFVACQANEAFLYMGKQGFDWLGCVEDDVYIHYPGLVKLLGANADADRPAVVTPYGCSTSGDVCSDLATPCKGRTRRIPQPVASGFAFINKAAFERAEYVLVSGLLVQQVSLVHTNTDYSLPNFYTWIPTTRVPQEHDGLTKQLAFTVAFQADMVMGDFWGSFGFDYYGLPCEQTASIEGCASVDKDRLVECAKNKVSGLHV
jgi:hypothetical protein